MMVKRTPRRTTRKSKARSHPPREATAKDVMGSLLDLFEHLGIDVSSPITGTARAASREFPQHSLYPHTSSISELLTLWHQDPAYVDDLGNPAPIKLHGPKPSFRQLVRQSQIALNEAYLLSELERLGAVSIDGSDLIKVQMRSFPVYEDKRLAAQHTLATLNGFIKTLRHNLNTAPANSDQLFHRIVWNGDFDNHEIPALKIKVKRHGQSLLESFDNWLMRKALSKPRNRKGRTGRSKVSIGVYLSVEPR
jgi:hypothetical protein